MTFYKKKFLIALRLCSKRHRPQDRQKKKKTVVDDDKKKRVKTARLVLNFFFLFLSAVRRKMKKNREKKNYTTASVLRMNIIFIYHFLSPYHLVSVNPFAREYGCPGWRGPTKTLSRPRGDDAGTRWRHRVYYYYCNPFSRLGLRRPSAISCSENAKQWLFIARSTPKRLLHGCCDKDERPHP